MSATGRPRRGKVDRATPPLLEAGVASVEAPGRDNGEEFFPTPPHAILSLLESDLLQLPGGRWIEPCAGAGNLVQVVNQVRADVIWTLCELDPRHEDALARAARPVDLLLPFGDFIARAWPWERAPVLIMNPPFSLALDFVIAAFARAEHVVMLQRLNWFAPARNGWLREHCPDVYALPKRPSFTRDKKTDGAECGWFHWPLGGRDRRVGRIAMLEHARGGQLDLLAGGA